jgi:proline racemase
MRLERTVQVVDSHTAGHPTRVFLGGLPVLEGTTVRERRDDFRTRFDHLRPQLLHEPRGHAAMVGAVLTESRAADFGAFFISSYAYLDMCGHATIGLAKTLGATGQIDLACRSPAFTLETPAGIVTVEVAIEAGEIGDIAFRNVPAHVEEAALAVEVPGVGEVAAAIAWGGCRYALVDAGAYGWPLTPDLTGQMCRRGAAIKAALNAGRAAPVDSVLLFEKLGPACGRHLVVLESHKFDRSPCGTGTSARIAQLVAAGGLELGSEYEALSVLGTRFGCRVEEIAERDGRMTVVTRITGRGWLTAFSTLVVEVGDPLAAGFLCR